MASGHVPLGDSPGEAFDHGGLADAGLAGEDRVVLPATRQDVDNLTDFRIAAQNRVDLAASSSFGEVDSELIERCAACRPGRSSTLAAAGQRR